MNYTKRGRDAGLSMLEVMIASIIMTIVMLCVYKVLETGSSVSANGSIHSQLQTRGREFLDFCKGELTHGLLREKGTAGGSTQVLGIHGDHTILHYRVPVRRDRTGRIDFGYKLNRPKGPVGGVVFNEPDTIELVLAGDTVAYSIYTNYSCVVRFEAQEILREPSAATTPVVHPTSDPALPTVLPAYPILTDTRVTVDINKDSDRTGIFVRGRIMRYILEPNPKPSVVAPPLTPPTAWSLIDQGKLSDDVILRVNAAGKFEGMVGLPQTPADIAQDWLFRYIDVTGGTESPAPVGAIPNATTSRGVAVTIWHGQWSDDGKYYMVNRSVEKYAFKYPQ